ncbi:alpha/beta fold hydrolase [Candidatus Woesearchaeota archaeon]|nr:alpha/beta fold hydrolase [Candidatus Woesearchaeota archaeon]MBT5272734.1 alpha/beta fold hydrolase [Candidatus Woesearchaeota archaeon]MBT6040345.1 alpha/beta fold hydrolase [Candidatus Woesearchaeota archaeon]MBT6337021.1 alpha/beta fold hydrolase [Candidatus Woesearchaeota archaeon]MBT7927925.1 alpha/beta fold hydrolase [Candidatus Woesearchaeota archaeon]
MEEKIEINSAGYKLNAILNIPEKANKTEKIPLVIICHGFRAQIMRPSYVNIAAGIAEKGIASLRFDFFGHGASQGKFEDLTPEIALQNLKDVFEFLMSNDKFDFVDKSRIAVFGSSFGGMISLLFASSFYDKLKFIILKAPVSNFKDFWNSKFDVQKWKNDGFIMHSSFNKPTLRLNYSFYETGASFDVYKMAEKIKCGVYVIHGTGDKIVPIEQSEELIEHLHSEKELNIVKGADHLFSDPEHKKYLLSWLLDKVAEKI